MMVVAAAAVPAMAAVSTPPAGGGGAQPAVPDMTLAAIQDVAHAHVRPLVTRIIHASANRVYTVRSGDTLSGIAGKRCGSAGRWPSLFNANKKVIGADPDLITPGQTFRMVCDGSMVLPAAPVRAVVTDNTVSAAPVHEHASDQDACTPECPFGDGDRDGMDRANSPFQSQSVSSSSDSEGSGFQSQQQAPVQATAQVTGASGTAGGSFSGNGGMQSCIISRESGGNSQVMNSSGHYGLYQFSSSTWAAHGGNPADFGHASVAEQNTVYQATVAADGYSDWAPYDGC